MIVDTSAVLAILLREPDHEWLVELLVAEDTGIGAPTLVEAGVVLEARLGTPGRSLLARFVEESALAVIPFDARHAAVAVSAYSRFGKGRHPAALNLGDCLTYATARIADQPLLCVGQDFPRTDLTIARSDVEEGEAAPTPT